MWTCEFVFYLAPKCMTYFYFDSVTLCQRRLSQGKHHSQLVCQWVGADNRIPVYIDIDLRRWVLQRGGRGIVQVKTEAVGAQRHRAFCLQASDLPTPELASDMTGPTPADNLISRPAVLLLRLKNAFNTRRLLMVPTANLRLICRLWVLRPRSQGE